MSRRLKLVLIVVGLALLAALMGRPVKVMWNLAALERAGGAEIWVEFQMPGWMPKSWREKLAGPLNQRERGMGWTLLAGATLALGGELPSLAIESGAFRRQVPEIRKRFPDLRIIGFYGGNIAETEADATKLCADLRAYPSLEEIYLVAEPITDAALAPLAGHPRLKLLYVDVDSETDIRPPPLTARSIDTFASMPALRELTIRSREYPDRVADLEKLKARLPQVRVDWR
jgi:hypothetical protein